MQDDEIKRFEGMLQYSDDLNTAANIANANPHHAKEMQRETRKWFNANCISYIKEEPYKSFDFALKLVSSYVADPVIFAKARVNKGGDLFIFEQITELRETLEAKLAELRAKQVDR